MHMDERPSVAQTHSIPQPRSARPLLAVELPPPVEEAYPRIFMVGQPKHHKSELLSDEFPRRLHSFLGKPTSKLK